MQQYQERTNCQERKQQRKREEGKAQAVSVTEEDNTHNASCLYPCNYRDYSLHTQYKSREGEQFL